VTALCATCGSVLTPDASASGLCVACLFTTALADDPESPFDDGTALPTFASGSMLGSFRIVKLLGRGGMGTVYEARDDRLDRAVALKVLPPEFLHDPRFAERFSQEARIVAALEHPNIVPIYASGIDNGIPWMSMRLLGGGTIGTLLEQGRPDARRIVQLLRAVADALDYAHARGVVHRDVKPTNILLDGADGVCVGDFGLAFMLDVGARMTGSGLLAGTPHYMAPEQALGQTADRRCDIYSLAIVAYEMFVGVTPFTGDSPLAVLMKHVNEPLPAAPEQLVARRVMRAIHKGAAKQPAERWPSATAFVDAVEAAIGARRNAARAPWVGAVAGAALAALAIGWFADRNPSAPVQRDHVQFGVRTPPAAARVDPPLVPTRQPVAPDLRGASGQRTRANGAQERSKPGTTQTTAPMDAASPASVPLDAVSSLPAPSSHVTAGGDVPSPTTADDDVRVPGTVPSRPLVTEVVTPPARIRTVGSEYPQAALAAQLEGDVLLEAVVTAEGKVSEVSIVRSVHPLLDESARKAVLQYEYTPAKRNGVSQAATVRMTVSFRLR
jgi:TonB family protein